jgi:hypothetical protein
VLVLGTSAVVPGQGLLVLLPGLGLLRSRGAPNLRLAVPKLGLPPPKPGLLRPTGDLGESDFRLRLRDICSAPSRLSVPRLHNFRLCAFQCHRLATVDARTVSNVRKRVCSLANDQNAVTIGLLREH